MSQPTSGNVNRAEVYQAANEIAACGEMPSIKMVRTFLGDRGSESTLQKYLKEWKLELLHRGTNTAGCIFCDEAQRLANHYRGLLEDIKKVLLNAAKDL